MGFDMLLGNEQLKANLHTGIKRGRASHFYLISGPSGAGKRTLAKLLSAALLCTGTDKPCLTCPACRKVMADTHPDVITVDDDEKKTVPVDLIRQARADVYVRPNEGMRKIYCFPRGHDIGIPGQNALLKILEEPPEYGVFIVLTENPQKMLATIRSRCTELSLKSLPESVLRAQLQKDFPDASADKITASIARSGGYLGQAKKLLEKGASVAPQTEAFVRAYAAGSAVQLTHLFGPLQKAKRDDLLALLQQWAELMHNALVYRTGTPVLSPMAQKLGASKSTAELTQAIAHLQKAIEYTQGNISPAAICGYLEWVLR